ncbi:MAG: hypothetical protein WDN04_16765 [Rhodospirillales bacterium]
MALAWDSFLVAVVVAELVLEFLNPWWIPYRIRCVVAPGMSATAGGGTSSLELDILTDIGVAANFVDIGATAVALNATGALVGGTSALRRSLWRTRRPVSEHRCKHRNSGVGGARMTYPVCSS